MRRDQPDRSKGEAKRIARSIAMDKHHVDPCCLSPALDVEEVDVPLLPPLNLPIAALQCSIVVLIFMILIPLHYFYFYSIYFIFFVGF